MKCNAFQSYVSNLNRVRFIELIDNCQAELRLSSLRASLVVNPVTGLAYDPPSALQVSSAHAAAA